MRTVKWIFFGYVAAVVLLIAGIAVSFGMTVPRDPHTLYLAYGANIKTLDPAVLGDTASGAVAGQVYETLFNYDYEARPYAIVPELAAGMPQVSGHGLTVTIPIRAGVHFYDPEGRIPGWEPVPGTGGAKGPAVTAKDFVYAWKRLANFHLASPNYPAMLEGRVKGLDDWREHTRSRPADQIDWDRRVDGLEAVDDHTLRIHLTRPDPLLRYTLAHLSSAPVSREAAVYWGDDLRRHPVGTGPYYLREHLPEQRVVLEANPLYCGRADLVGGRVLPEDEDLPHVRRIQMDYFAEDLPAWALFQQGLLDVAGIPKDTFAQAIDARTRDLSASMAAKGIVLRKEPYPAVFYYGFNMRDPVVGRNKPLRQAMSMAVDRQRWIELFANGRGRPAIGPVPPGFATFDPELVNPYTRHDLEMARAKMAEARRVHGGPIPPIKLLMGSTDTTSRQMAEFLRKQMAQIGVTLEPDYVTWARFQEMIDGGQAQFYALGWVAEYPDEQTFLQLFWTGNATPGPNSSNYSNPEYDRLYERARAMEPGPARDALYRRMQQIVMEDVPWVLTYYPTSYTLHYDWVANLRNNEYAHGNRKFLRLEGELRRERLSALGTG